jgi:DNA polymerase-3 subunit delta'
MSLPRGLPWLGAARRSAWTLVDRGVHAILLHGARGIGKKSLALDLARDLLCESRSADDSFCGTCAGCALTAAGNHPDFRLIVPDALQALRLGVPTAEDGEEVQAAPEKSKRPSKEIRIEQIRTLARFVNIATHRAGRRVCVIAPAEAMNAPAANSLLKLLEEPPDQTVFLLCTDALDQLAPTILSRCVLLRVAGPGPEIALQWLTAQGAPDAAAHLAAAGGAPLAALELARGAEAEEGVRALMLGFLRQGPGADAAGIVRGITRDVAVAPALTAMQRWCWDLLAFRLTRTVRYHPAEVETIEQISARASPGKLWTWWEAISRRQASREHPLNERLVIESLLLQYRDCLPP